MGPTRVDAPIAWRREPTSDQWLAWVAGWLGWTLDAFDFNPTYLAERFPTEVRGTASAFCYHIGAIFGGAVPLAVTVLAGHGMGLATAMLAGTIAGAISFCLALLTGPETRGTKFVPDLVVA